MIAWFKEVIRKHRLKYARICLEKLMVDKDPELYRNLRYSAEVLAKDMCMTFLDNKGYNHCKFCPNTEQLLNVNRQYVCKGHFDRLAEIAEAKGVKPSPITKLDLVLPSGNHAA